MKRQIGEFIRCPKCGEYKYPDEFYRNKSNSGGLQPYCKVCAYLDNKPRLEVYYQNHKEQHRISALASYHRCK